MIRDNAHILGGLNLKHAESFKARMLSLRQAHRDKPTEVDFLDKPTEVDFLSDPIWLCKPLMPGFRKH